MSTFRIPSPIATWLRTGTCALKCLQSPALLLARLYLAQVFFLSGLTKTRDWEITVALFTDEYHVPFLSPSVAALLATGAELILPVMLVLGLGTRFAAIGLFIVNFVAVISYPDLPAAGIQQHYLWGSLLTVLALWGAGKISLDQFIDISSNTDK